MSDDFDKEAEREKLREQFEADRKRRETTQQMSELLLKGATMTNMHCDSCGDPVFRHEGQEFCANCQTVATDDAADPDAAPDPSDTAADAGDAAAGTNARDAAATGPDAATTDERGDESGDAPARADEVPVEPQSRDSPRGPERSSGGSADRSPEQRDATAARTRDESDRGRRARGADADATPAATRSTSVADEAVDAPAALQQSLEKFSRLAAETDDPREAKRHLEAAREAAEALAALRQ